MGTLRETTNKSNQLTLSDCVFRFFKNNFKIINVWFEIILTGHFSQEKYFFLDKKRKNLVLLFIGMILVNQLFYPHKNLTIVSLKYSNIFTLKQGLYSQFYCG